MHHLSVRSVKSLKFSRSNSSNVYCFSNGLWDNGLALPAVPKNLVLGQPVGSESIEAWEFVLFTESADSLAFEMARRPHDPHDISVDDAQNILDIWLTKFNQDIPYVHRSDDFSLSLFLSLSFSLSLTHE